MQSPYNEAYGSTHKVFMLTWLKSDSFWENLRKVFHPNPQVRLLYAPHVETTKHLPVFRLSSPPLVPFHCNYWWIQNWSSCFIKAVTHYFPCATVPIILGKLLDLLHLIPAMSTWEFHEGTNDTNWNWIEIVLTKIGFESHYVLKRQEWLYILSKDEQSLFFCLKLCRKIDVATIVTMAFH